MRVFELDDTLQDLTSIAQSGVAISVDALQNTTDHVELVDAARDRRQIRHQLVSLFAHESAARDVLNGSLDQAGRPQMLGDYPPSVVAIATTDAPHTRGSRSSV